MFNMTRLLAVAGILVFFANISLSADHIMNNAYATPNDYKFGCLNSAYSFIQISSNDIIPSFCGTINISNNQIKSSYLKGIIRLSCSSYMGGGVIHVPKSTLLAGVDKSGLSSFDENNLYALEKDVAWSDIIAKDDPTCNSADIWAISGDTASFIHNKFTLNTPIIAINRFCCVRVTNEENLYRLDNSSNTVNDMISTDISNSDINSNYTNMILDGVGSNYTGIFDQIRR
jgi:hypothetical protein